MTLKMYFIQTRNRTEKWIHLKKGPLMKNLSQKIAELSKLSSGIFCADCVVKTQHYSLARNPFRCAGNARLMFIPRNLNVLAS